MRATPPFGLGQSHESFDVGPRGSALGTVTLSNALSNGK
jgi:hypothetical protein